MGILQGLLVGLEIPGHAIEAPAEIGELVAAGNGDAMGEIAFGEFGRAVQKFGERGAQAAQQEHHKRKRGENGERRMDLAHALEPAQEAGGVGIDPDHFGGLVGDTNLDKLVEFLVDTPFEEID
jgi:hypothetical protein